jgi:hypothetical protein
MGLELQDDRSKQLWDVEDAMNCFEHCGDGEKPNAAFSGFLRSVVIEFPCRDEESTRRLGSTTCTSANWCCVPQASPTSDNLLRRLIVAGYTKRSH